MKAIGKRVVIQHIDEELKTESGILLSASEKEKMRYKKCVILSVGNECADIIREGLTAYYDASAGHKMMLEEKIVTIISERDLVVVL